MPTVATLIPSTPTIQPQLINELLAMVEEANHPPIAIDWLEPRRVVDLFFEHALPKKLIEKLRMMCGPFMADLIVQPTQTRDKKMLISDMDSTMITVECIDELADFVGKKDEVARITERAMNGELDFSSALNERVALLAGLPVTSLEACYRERVKFMPGAAELVAVMKRQDVYCLLVSGGFDFFTSRVASVLGFDAEVSNKLEIENGKLTGKVIEPIFDKQGKVEQMQAHAFERDITLAEIIAVGDGANDLPMLKAAGLGIAYWAKPHVREQADNLVDYNDLTALMYAQGFAFRPEQEK